MGHHLLKQFAGQWFAFVALGATATTVPLQVLWSSAQQTSAPKPEGWATDNVYLGRWEAGSTAGRAILDVLTLEPNRVRWGSDRNGICDSDYSVKILPWGRNGRFPDQLIPPSSPTDLVYSVVRLTLNPGPAKQVMR